MKNNSTKAPFQKSTIFLLTVLVIGGLSALAFKTANSSNDIEETTIAVKTKPKPTVKKASIDYQHKDMTAENWTFKMPDCMGTAKPDHPEMTDIYLTVHAPKEIETLIYEEIGVNRFKKREYSVAPLRYYERCFSSNNFGYNIENENFASFFDFICVATYNSYLNKEKSTNTKDAYDQSANIIIYETRSGGIAHRLNTKIKTAYFSKGTTNQAKTARLHKDLKKGLARIKIPKLIDPELLEKKTEL